MDDVSWRAIYMQEPIEREGLLYQEDELQYFFTLPKEKPDAIVAVCDSKGQGKDYVCAPCGYVYGDMVYIKEVVFANCELKEASENQDGKSDLEKLKEQLAISITSKQNQQADIKFVNSQVNQDEAETLAQTLIDYVYSVTGIPDRKTRSNGGVDTLDAVYLRDGWASLEVVARTKERYFRKSEKQMLKIICRILKVFRGIKIKPMHIEPTFVRNRTNNLLNKAQAMAILKELKFIDPIDIVTLGGISDNPIDLVKRGLDYYEKQEEVNAENQSRNSERFTAAGEMSILQQAAGEA